MTFMHMTKINSYRGGKGFIIYFHDTNHTLEENEAKLLYEKIYKIGHDEFKYNMVEDEH